MRIRSQAFPSQSLLGLSEQSACVYHGFTSVVEQLLGLWHHIGFQAHSLLVVIVLWEGVVITRCLTFLNVFLCSSVQLNSLSCQVRQCISSIWSAKRVRNFDKKLTNPFSVCMLISLA